MNYNKSLSARIRRRNAQGFEGVGTGLGFLIKNSGDYTDPNQNHKYTGINHVANQAYSIGLIGKHKGSKPIKRIKNLISQFDSKRYWEDRAKNERLR